jgi:hypothetical protein
MTKANTPPTGLPALRSKRKDNAELQPVSKKAKAAKGYVR